MQSGVLLKRLQTSEFCVVLITLLLIWERNGEVNLYNLQAEIFNEIVVLVKHTY